MKFAIAILGALMILAIFQMQNSGAGNQPPMSSAVGGSPWDSLSATEIEQAAAAVKARHGNDVLFNRISLQQPLKRQALSWQTGQTAHRAATLSFRAEGQSHYAQYDYSTATLSPTKTIETGQPMLSADGELAAAVAKVNEDATVLAALATRGIQKNDAICLPRTTGRFFSALADPARDRLLRLDCFYIAGQGGLGLLPSPAAFARPIEGLSLLYDVERQSILEIQDSYQNAPPPPHDISAMEFHEGALTTRPRLRPVRSSRPEGVNFKIAGSRVDWQNWQFYLRFDPRQGTILNRVGHVTPEGFRSVAYEIAMSEMFVPYYDTDPHWFYRAYFDMGEYGLGNMATELKGSDCPSHAVYQPVVLHTSSGEPRTAENRICIFEHDPGYPIWRHHESLYDGIPGMDNHQSRTATELVVRMVATIGNYDYFQDYIFQQDGRLRIRMVATGIDATKGVFARTLDDPTAPADTETGTLIAPNLVGINHDHYFSYRIDMDVDGPSNHFERHRLKSIAQPEGAPRQGIWGVTSERVSNELAARTRMEVSKPALLVFASSQRQNAMGYATGYQVIMPNVRPLVTLQDATHRRARFVEHNLWVTRYKQEEIFSAGLMVNQSAPDQGLPSYVNDDESIEGTDLVAWPTMGFHHVPMAEDWPVMPAKVDEIVLKPRNYFDHNPAIDLPSGP
ncbi:MAG: hypothetical protein O2858_07725 [Proteobacteria bacterium]|jgi:primary-amine oxidase|nr:hypothetical protein [Pseudomonadota bacterium]